MADDMIETGKSERNFHDQLSVRNTLLRMAFCAWFWSLTARLSSASIRISACCTAAPRS